MSLILAALLVGAGALVGGAGAGAIAAARRRRSSRGTSADRARPEADGVGSPMGRASPGAATDAAARSSTGSPAPRDGHATATATATAGATAGATARTTTAALAAFPVHLGDVLLLRANGDEAWLADGWLFVEGDGGARASGGAAVAALLFSPGAGGGTGVFVRPLPERAVVWLAPLDATGVAGLGLARFADLAAADRGADLPSAIEIDRARFERRRRLPVRVVRLGTGAPDVGDTAIVGEYASQTGEHAVVVHGAGGVWVGRGARIEPAAYDRLPSGAATLDPT